MKYMNFLYKDDYIRGYYEEGSKVITAYTFAPYKDFKRTEAENGNVYYEKEISLEGLESISVTFECNINNLWGSFENIDKDTVKLLPYVTHMEWIPELKEKYGLDVKMIGKFEWELTCDLSQIEGFRIETTINNESVLEEVSRAEFFKAYKKFYSRPSELDIYRYMRNKFQLTEKNAVENLEKLAPYYEIMNEIQYTRNTGRMVADDEDPVTIQGYTAKKLFETTYLNELGAYNYLIYLRENPEEALKNLQKGLPRK